MGSSLARLLAMTQMGQQPGQNPLAAMIAAQQGMAGPPIMSAPQAPIPGPAGVPPQGMAPPGGGTGMPRPQTRGSVPGILSRFNSSLMNTLAPNPGQQVEGLIGADAIKSAQSQALLSLGASLLANSGYSAKPTTLGEVLGRGLQASQETYRNALGDSVNGAVSAQNASSWEEQRRATAAAAQELAQQRATQRALDESIARARPKYASRLNGMDGLSLEQKYARYTEIQSEALAAGDMDTYNKLETSKNMLLQYAPKQPGNQQYTTGGDGQLYRVERQPDGTVKEVPVGQPRPRPVGGGGGSGGGGTAAPKLPDGLEIPKGWTTPFNDFNKNAVKIADSGANLSMLENRLASTQLGTDQYDLIFQFLKSRDGSVVRESEIAGLRSTDPVVRKVAQFFSINRLRTGQTLSPATAQQLLRVMRQEYEVHRKSEATRADATSRALAPRMTSYDFNAMRELYGLPPLQSGTPAAQPSVMQQPAAPAGNAASRGFTFTPFTPSRP